MRNLWLLIVLSFNLVADGNDDHKKSKCYDEEEIDLPDNFTVRYVSPDGNDDIDNDCTDKHNPCRTIQKALDEASPGDVIELLKGVFFEPAEVIIPANKSPIFIFGQGQKNSIIDGNDTHRLFFISTNANATFCGLTLRNGNGVGSAPANFGGAIQNRGTINAIIDVSFNNNSASVRGGAISNHGPIIIINNVIFRDNESIALGGALFNDAAITSITYSDFINNRSNNGGALFNQRSISSITHNNFRDNEAVEGGAILNTDTIITINNSDLSHNKAETAGGAISNSGAITLIEDSILNCNKVTDSTAGGGAIYNQITGVITTILDSLLNDNEASSSSGGAILNQGIIANISESIISDNKADNGGAIFNQAITSILNISNSTLCNNQARGDGGAIFNQLSIIEIENSTLANNEANNNGGAIFNEATTNIFASTLNNNKSHDDGGAIFNESGTTTIVNSTLSGNKAHDSGGGILNNLGTTNIRNSTITENLASDAAVVRVAGSIVVYSTIIGDQRKDTDDCSGFIADDGFNLDSDGSCNWTNPNSFTDDPELEPLDNYGGPTETHRPFSSSPAINASELGNCEVSIDQRGFPRPSPPGGRCDIGSVEIQQTL